MDDNRYRSRKFLIAAASFVVVSLLAGYGLVQTIATAQDVAIIIGAWGVVDGAILKLYNDANLKALDGPVG